MEKIRSISDRELGKLFHFLKKASKSTEGRNASLLFFKTIQVESEFIDFKITKVKTKFKEPWSTGRRRDLVTSYIFESDTKSYNRVDAINKWLYHVNRGERVGNIVGIL